MSGSPYLKPAYRWYVLALLTLVYTFNFIDRQVVVILQEQIRVELGLMDWQLGLLSGFAFAIFYSVLGLPIAHFSESAGRKRVVAVCYAVILVSSVLLLLVTRTGFTEVWHVFVVLRRNTMRSFHAGRCWMIIAERAKRGWGVQKVPAGTTN